MGGGTGGIIRYPDDPTGPIHAVTSGGPGYLTLTPAALEPGRTLAVDVLSGFRRRRFTYRVAGRADERVDLYRAALVHWFRPPQAGWPGLLGFVALDESGTAGLTPEEKRQVALGMNAYFPFVGTGDVRTGSLEPVGAPPGGYTMSPRPTEGGLYLRLERRMLGSGAMTMEVIATIRGRDGEAVWKGRAVYRAEREDGAWEFSLIEGSEDGRPWGPGEGPSAPPGTGPG